MKAEEVLKRYREGERNFRRVNLIGQSFKGKYLSEADFSEADIRGANFTNANLLGANFHAARAGLQHRWAIGLVLASWLISGISAIFSAFPGYLVSLALNTSNPENFSAGISSLIVLTVLFIVTIRYGLAASLIAGAVAVAVAFAGAFAFAVAGTFAGAVAVARAFAFAFAVAGAVARAGAVTVAVTGAVAFAFAMLGVYVGWRGLAGDEKYAWVRSFAIAFAAKGGTSFRGANLTDAAFTSATLKSTDFRSAILTRTSWKQAEKLDRVRPGTTYLRNAQLRQWLIGNGLNKNFDRQDLRGVNLKGANLADASFIGADLSEANLQDADLSRAKLVQTQLDGTKLAGAYLTAACLEDVNITSTTKIDDIICEYFYLKYPDKDRRPSSGNFEAGDFTKYYQKALATVDLIFRNGIDWKAFLTSFQKLQVEWGGNELSIQAIENKNDGSFVIRVNVPPDANKAEIENYLKREYEYALKTLEEKYRYQLQTKDEQLADYRQLNTDLTEIVKRLADRPISNVIKVTAKAESESMSETSKYNLISAKFGGGFAGTGGSQTGGTLNDYSSTPNLSEATNTNAVKTILILASNPKNTSALRLGEEIREIDAGLQRAKKRELFDLKQRWAVRIQDVYQALLDFKPQFVHFSGHGAGDDGLVLEDETGSVQLVDTQALAELFKMFASDIECVVLNACYSEVQADVIAQHIPYVIGMNQAIGDKAAIKFATGFYNALGAGESVEFAYKLGCSVIQLDGIPENLSPDLKKKQ